MTLALLFSQTASAATQLTLAETAAVADQVSAAMSATASVAEAAATGDMLSIGLTDGGVTETAAATDAVLITMTVAASVAETAAATDELGNGFAVMIDLVGPSTNPGAPQITPAAINLQVNAALAMAIQQATLTARVQAANWPYLSDVGLTKRAAASRFGDVMSPFDFGAFGDGESHPASTAFQTLAACQELYPFATSLEQEMDFLAWQAALYAPGKVECRPSHFIMCNSNPASMTPLILLAGQAYAEGNGAKWDWSAIATQPNTTHFVRNYNFATDSDWVVDTVDPAVSVPVFGDGAAVITDPPSFTRFGQQVTLPPGEYVIQWAFTATLGGSYPENVSPPYGEINFWSDAPGAGDQIPWPPPQQLDFPNLTGVITAGEEGISVTGTFNIAFTETFTSYLCFTGGGYANWRVTLLDIVPFVPNCGILVTRDNSPAEHYNIYKSIKGFEIIGGDRQNSATGAGSTGPTGIMFQSFINNDGDLVDFEDCAIVNWGNGIWPRDGAYLLEFRNCLLYGNDVAVLFVGGVNAGENMRFYGGGIFNNLFGIMNPHPFGEWTFYGTALDYNYASVIFNAGKLEFHGMHIENNLKDIAIFNCSGGAIMMYGGLILGVAPLIPMSEVVPPMKLDDSNSLFTCFGTQIYNLTSADGTFIEGPGTFRAYGWMNTGNAQVGIPSLTTIAMDPLGGMGNLEPPSGNPFVGIDPTGIYLEGGVYSTNADAVITNRWTADDLAVAITTAQKHTGTQCISVTKSVLGEGSADYQIVFLIPVKPGQDASLSFWWMAPNEVFSSLAITSIVITAEAGYSLATVTTAEPHGLPDTSPNNTMFLFISGATQPAYNGTFFCTVTGASTFTYPIQGTPPTSPATGSPEWAACATMYARTYWAKQIGVDAYNRPVLSPANTFKGENDIPMPLCGNPVWANYGTGTQYGPPVTTPATGNSPGAPVWATHMALILDTESLPAMEFFLDDFLAYVI